MTTAFSTVERRTLAATVVIAVLLGLFAMNDIPVGVFQDDGHYMILARALARGDGYRYTNLPGAPAGTHFPPGYPLLLAPLWWLAPQFPANAAYFKLANVALLPFAALSVRRFARQVGGLSVLAASGVAVAFAATVPVLFLNGLLFSETVFIAALYAVLVIAEQLVAHTDGTAPRRVLGVGLAIGALAMLRTVGIAVLPALLAVLLWRRRWADAALVLGGALLVLLPWQLWTVVHANDVASAIIGGYGAYGAWLVDAYREGGMPFATAVLRENLRGLLIPLTLFGLIDAPRWAQLVAGLPMLALFAAGLNDMRRRAPATLLVLPPYLLLLLVWPFPPDRFLWPIWPLLLVAGVRGALGLGWGAHGVTRWQWPVRVGVAALVALFAVWHVRTWPSRNWERGERANARMGLAAASVAAALPADGLVASDMDAMVHLYADRQAVPLLALTAAQHVRVRTTDEVAAQLASVLQVYQPRWVVVTERESLRAAQELAKRGALRLVRADPLGVVLYDVVR